MILIGKVPALKWIISIILIIQTISINQLCPCILPNSYCMSNGYCNCSPGFILNCDVPGIQIFNGNVYQTNINNSYSYFNFIPFETTSYFKIQATFCQQSNISATLLKISIWLGQPYFSVLNQQNLVAQFQNQALQGCTTYSSPILKYEKQVNGKPEEYIIGLVLSLNSTQYIQFSVIQRDIGPTPTITIITYVIIGVICFVIAAFLISYLRRRLTTRSYTQRNTNQLNDIEYFEQYMPSKCVQNVKLPQGSICSVCLGQWVEKQMIRKTPCNHIFHTSCIDEWCIKNLTCPFCRAQLTEQKIIQNAKNKPKMIEMQWQQNPTYRCSMLNQQS